jgi:hypothetical protein
MKKKSLTESKDELRAEYDLRDLLKRGVRGKYAKRYQAGTNLVLLAPDVAKVFTDDEAVNEALRLAIQLGKLQTHKKRAVTKA